MVNGPWSIVDGRWSRHYFGTLPIFRPRGSGVNRIFEHHETAQMLLNPVAEPGE
jgi:hypothetical protein